MPCYSPDAYDRRGGHYSSTNTIDVNPQLRKALDECTSILCKVLRAVENEEWVWTADVREWFIQHKHWDATREEWKKL